MILCDIGNTSYHFLELNSDYVKEKDYKKSVDSFFASSIKEKVYYICVNPNVVKILESLDNWIDLSQNIDKTKYYDTMGVDRIVACEAISAGIIVDAGSAITVDVVDDSKFMGGFIYPGIKAMSNTYKNISSALNYDFNFSLPLNNLAKNSQDAISYGYLKILYTEVVSHNKQVYLTGGDAKEFKKIFKDATINENLIFDGMIKILKKY